MELWPLLAVERPVCTVKAPSSHSTRGLRGGRDSKKVHKYRVSIIARREQRWKNFGWMRFINWEKSRRNYLIK